MAGVNLVALLPTRAVLPAPIASLLGIAVGAAGNYVMGDRLVFRAGRAADSRGAPERYLAASRNAGPTEPAFVQ